jgi:hypothetical protein
MASIRRLDGFGATLMAGEYAARISAVKATDLSARMAMAYSI